MPKTYHDFSGGIQDYNANTHLTSFDFLDIDIEGDGLISPRIDQMMVHNNDGILKVLNPANTAKTKINMKPYEGKGFGGCGPSLVSKKSFRLNKKSYMHKSNNIYTSQNINA